MEKNRTAAVVLFFIGMIAFYQTQQAAIKKSEKCFKKVLTKGKRNDIIVKLSDEDSGDLEN